MLINNQADANRIVPELLSINERLGSELPKCGVCGYSKSPLGRSAALGTYHCNCDCPGYQSEPRPDTLWPGERQGDVYEIPTVAVYSGVEKVDWDYCLMCKEYQKERHGTGMPETPHPLSDELECGPRLIDFIDKIVIRGPVDTWECECEEGGFEGCGSDSTDQCPIGDRVPAPPVNLAYIRNTIRQCEAHGVEVEIERLGQIVVDSDCAESDGTPGLLSGLSSKDGSDPSEWPEDLRQYVAKAFS